jgi:hypothetical protein
MRLSVSAPPIPRDGGTNADQNHGAGRDQHGAGGYVFGFPHTLPVLQGNFIGQELDCRVQRLCGPYASHCDYQRDSHRCACLKVEFSHYRYHCRHYVNPSVVLTGYQCAQFAKRMDKALQALADRKWFPHTGSAARELPMD